MDADETPEQKRQQLLNYETELHELQSLSIHPGFQLYLTWLKDRGLGLNETLINGADPQAMLRQAGMLSAFREAMLWVSRRVAALQSEVK